MNFIIEIIKNIDWKIIPNIVSSLAAAISSYFVYITLKEMRKERIAELRPSIILDSEGYLNITADENIFEEEINKNFKLKLKNIGAGSAKNIKYKFSKKSVLKFLNKEVKNNPNCSYKIDKDRITCMFTSDMEAVAFFDLNEVKFQPYLLPEAKKSEEILLPPIFEMIYREMLLRGDFAHMSRNSFSIEVSYYDTQGIKYSTELNFSIDFFMASSYPNGVKTNNKYKEVKLDINLN